MPEHEIITARLRLRRWKPDDHSPFAALCADPEVMRHIGNGSTRTAAEASKSIHNFEAEWEQRGYGLFAVENLHSRQLIGFTGLSWPVFLPEVLPAVEIGWRFSKPNWGQGYASEAATAALAFAVNNLGLTDIVSIYQVENKASARIMQKLGLRFDRRTLDPSCNREIEVYRLPQHELPPVKSPMQQAT